MQWLNIQVKKTVSELGNQGEREAMVRIKMWDKSQEKNCTSVLQENLIYRFYRCTHSIKLQLSHAVHCSQNSTSR